MASLANFISQPSIIKDLGYSAAEAQLLTIPPYVRFSLLVRDLGRPLTCL
jgi:hypothetical protein